MGPGFVLLLLIGVVLVLVFAFTHVLEELANERESAPRRRQKRIRPRSEDTITYSGNS
jgi:fatty acid desaturase